MANTSGGKGKHARHAKPQGSKQLDGARARASKPLEHASSNDTRSYGHARSQVTGPIGYESPKAPRHQENHAVQETQSYGHANTGAKNAQDTDRLPVVESAQYDRSEKKYASSKKKRVPVWKKVIIGIAAVLATLLVATGAYAAWYMHKIDQALSYNGADSDAIGEVTESVNLSKPFYMLIMGSDSRDSASANDAKDSSRAGERSDVIILARIDAPNKKITLVSIPRDTPYTMEDGTVCKINETYNKGGAAYTIKAVEQVTGVDIAHFAELRFSDLENMVDALGGVTVYVDTALSYKDALTGERIYIDAGEQTLNGQQAQIFVRARHEYGTDQDMHRQNNVRQLATAMLKAVLDRPVSQIPDTVLELAQYVHTDLKSGDLLKLARSFSGNDITVFSCTGPNLGDFSEENGGIWLCYQNPQGWAALMATVDAGEDPSGMDVNSMAEKPEGSEESQTEGTEEPILNEDGTIASPDVQVEDGGYVEDGGIYYYEPAEEYTEEIYVDPAPVADTVETQGGDNVQEPTPDAGDTQETEPVDGGDDGGDGEPVGGDTGGTGDGGEEPAPEQEPEPVPETPVLETEPVSDTPETAES